MMKRVFKILITVIFLIPIVWWLFIFDPSPTPTNKFTLKYFKENEFKGRVINSYVNHADRGAVVLTLVNDGDTVTIINYHVYSLLTEKLIEVGDSIVKRRDSLSFEVYKQMRADSIILINNKGYSIISK